MRLIDADALIEAIDPMYIAKKDIVADTFAEGCMQFEKLIKQQPTAYDVNKVIERLEELDVGTMYCSQCKYNEECESITDDMLKKYELDDRTDLCAMLMKVKAIEIVKKGGKE